MTATHAPAQPPGESGLTLTLCGRFEARTAATDDAVTCKACRRKLATAPTDPSPAPSEWRPSLSGTKYDRQYDAIAYADVPGRREHRYRWPSVERALRDYAITLHDGFSSKSVTAGITRFARLGAQIQGGQRRSPKAESQAEDAAAVDQALAWACGHREAPEARTQRVIVLARVVGVCRGRVRRTRQGFAVDSWEPVPAESLARQLEVDEYEVGAVVREVKRWLRIEMHARRLTPPPHQASEVERAVERRKELLHAERVG